MSTRYDDDTDIRLGGKAIIVWGLAIVAVLLIAALAFGWLTPVLNNMEWTGIRSSNTSVQTRTKTLVDLRARYQELETERVKFEQAGNTTVVSSYASQQTQVIRQMCQEKSLMPDNTVPNDMRQFLSGRC